ncbi:MAG: hypothetical protein LUB61_03550 [Eggerthellaceae bacterium]|nr:hypothetical protein [Eggerthellaceae bacterium]
MGSKKPSANAKKIREFKALSNDPLCDEAFRSEEMRHDQRHEALVDADKERSCTSKNRYATLGEAKQAIKDCERHGTFGLHAYLCKYCKGWHLTSRQPND